MSEMLYVDRFAIEGDYAKKVYDVLEWSYVSKNRKQPSLQGCHDYELEYRYEDGVLYIEERNADGWVGYMMELLCFVIGHMNFYASRVYIVDGVTTPVLVSDDEGKYFVHPPKTEHELQQEAEQVARTTKSDDMPF